MDALSDPDSIFDRARSLCANDGFYDARLLLEDFGPQMYHIPKFMTNS